MFNIKLQMKAIANFAGVVKTCVMGLVQYSSQPFNHNRYFSHLVRDSKTCPPALFELTECLTNRRKSIFSLTRGFDGA